MTPLATIFDWLRDLDPRIWQALIAGSFVALGWVVNGWRNRREARTRRRERVRDVQKAIYAEIRAYLEVLRRDRLDTYGANILSRIKSGGDGTHKFVPFIPTEHNSIVFEAIVEDIHVLPRATIDPIVLYYSQLTAINALIADLRSDGYANMDAGRRAAMYADYISMKVAALEMGEDALQEIELYDEFGVTGNEALAAYKDRLAREQSLPEVIAWVERKRMADANAQDQISTPGAARSDR